MNRDMNIEPWIGDATPDGETGCSFRKGALGDGPKCQNAPTLHILSESAIHGLVALPTCDEHAPAARAAGSLNDEHPFGPGCRADVSWWTRAGYCLPEPPDGVA